MTSREHAHFGTVKWCMGKRNLHCDVVYITTKWVSSLTLDCNGVFAIKAYRFLSVEFAQNRWNMHEF